jgi:hypothetical protein
MLNKFIIFFWIILFVNVFPLMCNKFQYLSQKSIICTVFHCNNFCWFKTNLKRLIFFNFRIYLIPFLYLFRLPETVSFDLYGFSLYALLLSNRQTFPQSFLLTKKTTVNYLFSLHISASVFHIAAVSILYPSEKYLSF